DVVGEVVVVGVGGEGQVGQHGAEMQHGGELDAELAGGMHGDAELEGLADAGSLDAGPHAAPKGGVEQDDVDRRIEDVGGQLLVKPQHHFNAAAWATSLSTFPTSPLQVTGSA